MEDVEEKFVVVVNKLIILCFELYDGIYGDVLIFIM